MRPGFAAKVKVSAVLVDGLIVLSDFRKFPGRGRSDSTFKRVYTW